MQPGQHHRSAQEVQGADLVRERDLVGDDGGDESDIQGCLVPRRVACLRTVGQGHRDVQEFALLRCQRQGRDLRQRLSSEAMQSVRNGLNIRRRVRELLRGIVALARNTLLDPRESFSSFAIKLAIRQIVSIDDRDRTLAVAPTAPRADASDHEASDAQEEVGCVYCLVVAERCARLVDELEGASEDPRRGSLRETQELVARGPCVGVNGQ